MGKITDHEEIERMNSVPTEVIPEIDESGNKIKVESETVGDELTPRQLRFIELYCGDMLGNGVQAYLEVYDIDTSKPHRYKTACSASSRLLSNVKVYTKINQMLEDSGLNDNFIDKQLLFLVSQQTDFSSKLGAIREYNKIKQRITEKTEEKKDITIKIVE